MQNNDRKIYLYSFELAGKPYVFDLRAKEIRDKVSGKTVTHDGSILGYYFKTLIDAAMEPDPKRRAVCFEVFPRNSSAWDSHARAMAELRKLLRQIMSDRAVKRALPSGKRVEGKALYRLYAENIQSVSYSSRNSRLVDGRGDPLAVYREMNRYRAHGEAQIEALMLRLMKLFPKELDGFFFRTGRGTLLPFHLMDAETYGRPNWPMPVVDDDKATPGRARGADSLTDQRWLEGGRLYNGRLYQLMQARPERWVLGRTRYFEALDSCDYLRERILGLWGRICDDPSSASKDRALSASPVVQEWLDTIRAIRRGDFSTYAAGMAMNMPIFARRNDRLCLLMGRGAAQKAAGGGKFHVCPAGMLEFFKNVKAMELSFDDFRTYIIKELYEEGFRHPHLIDETIQNVMQGNLPVNVAAEAEILPRNEDYGDYVTTAHLEYCFDKTEAILESSGPAMAPALQLSRTARSMTPAHRSYQVLDAFRLRPEIIMPIFVPEMPQLFLGWEYHENTADLREISTMAELEAIARNERHKWAEPGLAGVYLALRDHFAAAGAEPG